MKILVVSSFGIETSLVWKLVKEGHDARLRILGKDYATTGEGFVKKVTDDWIPDCTLRPTPAITQANDTEDIQTGIEVYVSGFFTGSGFVNPIELSFPHDRIMNGNIGPVAPSGMGLSAVWIDKTKKIVSETLGKAIPQLESQDYYGFVQARCLVQKDAVTVRTWETGLKGINLFTKLETISEDWGKLLFEKPSKTRLELKISNPYSVAIAVQVPTESMTEGITFKKKNRGGVWPVQVKRDKNNAWRTITGRQFPIVVTGSGKSLQEAREGAYNRLGCVVMPEMMYRTDIGEKTPENAKWLQTWGWLK